MDDDRNEATREPAGAGSALIYCGLCGALNPSANHFCSACGSTLVDAFHATEGMRVFERPDPAARIIEIVPAGRELDIVDDPRAPADWVRIRLPYGRLGFIRLSDVAALAEGVDPARLSDVPDINKRALGCVSTTSALAALALLVLVALFGVVIIARAEPQDAGILTLVYCVTVVPLLLLTIGLYVGARAREDRMADEADAARREA
ncbi:MAG TPA: hypothetical protein VFI22_16535 [Thermomicrobiales bacterium]|nr:hypothetical protein [Thermomicrobiales bacterium]